MNNKYVSIYSNMEYSVTEINIDLFVTKYFT